MDAGQDTRDVVQLKRELRILARRQRASLEPVVPAWAELGPLLEKLAPAAAILTWLPAAGEPDPVGLQHITDHPLAVTRTPERGPVLTLHALNNDTLLERHPFGFLQPVVDSAVIQPPDIGLALVPGLAFDRRGARLGHGAGYYDRLLARLNSDTPLVGVVHSSLVLEQIPLEEHDVRMTHLLTEKALWNCRAS